MVLPSKHLRLSDSLLGIGCLVLEQLTHPRTLQELCAEVLTEPSLAGIPQEQIVERVILALDMLYCIGTVRHVKGEISRCQA